MGFLRIYYRFDLTFPFVNSSSNIVESNNYAKYFIFYYYNMMYYRTKNY